MGIGVALYASFVFSKIEPKKLCDFSFLQFESGITVTESRSIQKHVFSIFSEENSLYRNGYDIRLSKLKNEIEKFLYSFRTDLDKFLENSSKNPDVEALKEFSEDEILNSLDNNFVKKLGKKEKQQIVSLLKRKTEFLNNKGRLNSLNSLEYPEFSEPRVLDLTEYEDSALKNLFEKNKCNNKIQSYVVNGHIRNNSHWFMVMQRRTDLFVIDPVGFKTREDFFKKFVLIKDFNIVAMKNPLQYGGNDCEGFANILPNYFIRLFLFNSLDGYSLDSVFVENKNTKAKIQKEEYKEFYVCTKDLISLLRDGLSEVSFGSIKENTRLVENQNIFNSRFESIEGQIYEIKRIRDVTFNNSQSFQEIFLYDLILTRNLLEYLILNRKAETGDLVEANMAFAGKEKKFEAKQKAVEFVLSNKLIFSRILEESIGFSSVLLNTMEKHIVTQEEVTSFLKFVVSSNYNELIVKELIKKQKVDFSNPKMSLPAGHIYWKTLEYAEMFDRRVTKWILSRNDEELSAERKKSMLSVIYPYHYNFSVVENGDNYVYLAIDRYYNSDLYSSVAESVLQIKIPFSRFVSSETEIFKKIVSSQDTLENLPHFIAWNRNFREDIFRHVATTNDEEFNQKIIPFFFETKEVDKDYVRVVAGKYTFSMINEKDNTTDYSQIGGDFAHMLIITEGNDRNDTFNTAIEKGKVLLHSNYHFRTGVFNWVLNKPTVGIKIKVSSMPVFNYIKNDDKEKDMFIKKLNVQRYLSFATTIDINTIKPLTEDMIFVFDTSSSSESFSHREGDIDDFSKAILGKVEELKATVTSMRRQQSATMAIAKPAAPKETEASAVRPKKKTSQEQQPPVEEKSEEELTLKVWEQFKNKIDEILQKFPDLTNLRMLHESI